MMTGTWDRYHLSPFLNNQWFHYEAFIGLMFLKPDNIQGNPDIVLYCFYFEIDFFPEHLVIKYQIT